MSQKDRQGYWIVFVLRTFAIAGLLVSGWLLFGDASTSARTEQRSPSVTPARSQAAAGYTTKAIEKIRVGDRVFAHNPEVTDAERATWAEPDWKDWLHLSLVMPKEDGSELKIQLLRPESWVLEQVSYIAQEREAKETDLVSVSTVSDTTLAAGERTENTPSKAQRLANPRAQESQAIVPLSPLRPFYRYIVMTSALLEAAESELVGLTVDMDSPEMGATGTAVIVDVSACPPVCTGEGQPVTATFSHPPSAAVLNVIFEGESEPIGVTDNHLFWSVDRQQFLPIGKMEIGEQVQTFHGDTKRIEAKLPRPGPQVVYNLEVYGEHVYFVGEQGLLAHNSYLDDSIGLMKQASVRFRNSPLLREVLAIDPIDNVRKWMRTNIRLGNRRSTQTLLDGDHVLPKDPVRIALAGQGLRKGDAAFDEAIDFINTGKNLRPMTSNLNSSKKDLSILAWVRQGGLAETADNRYLLRAAEIQRANAIQVRLILRKHGIRTSKSFLDDFTGQLKDLNKIL